MRSVLAALVLTLAMLGSVAAQTEETPPPQCRYNASHEINFEACLAASTPGSPWHSLSLMNLGTRAFGAADYATAVRYYDQSQPGDGQQLYSDPSFHAFYAATLRQVGRPEEAIGQARRSLAVIRGEPDVPADVRRLYRENSVDLEVVYAAILPVLHSAGDENTQSIMSAYLALPARDWISWANRAAVMLEIGDLPAALSANSQAMSLAPAEPMVLNNQCYILVSMDRASEALPHCLAARNGAPDIAAVRHSVASAYAALGRCAEAQTELAEARRLDPVTLEYTQPLVCAAR